MSNHDDKFEKAGPYLFMAPIVGWLMWCLSDMLDWFARFQFFCVRPSLGADESTKSLGTMPGLRQATQILAPTRHDDLHVTTQTSAYGVLKTDVITVGVWGKGQLKPVRANFAHAGFRGNFSIVLYNYPIASIGKSCLTSQLSKGQK